MVIRFPIERRIENKEVKEFLEIEKRCSDLWWDVLGQMAYAEMEKLDKEIVSHVDRLRE